MKKTKPTGKCKTQEVATCSGQAIELISIPAVIQSLDELIQDAGERLERAIERNFEGISFSHDGTRDCRKMYETVEEVRNKDAELHALIRLKEKLKFITLK